MIRLRDRQTADTISKLDLMFVAVLDDLAILHPEYTRMGITLNNAFEAGCVTAYYSNVFEWLLKKIKYEFLKHPIRYF